MDQPSRIFLKPAEWEGLAQLLADHGVFEFYWEEDFDGARWLAFNVPAGVDARSLRAALAQDPRVVAASLDPHFRFAAYNAVAGDALVGASDPWMWAWHHGRINTYRAWKILEDEIGSRGNPSVKVIDTDTGWHEHEDLPTMDPANCGTFDTTNVGLPAGLVSPGPGWDPGPIDIMGHIYACQNGHGSGTLGIIAGKGGNGLGISGLVPACTAGMMRIVAGWSDAPSAVKHAADIGARVINASWGGFDDGSGVEALAADMVAYCAAREVVFVVAAGNGSCDVSGLTPSQPFPTIPANTDGSITVAAMAPTGCIYAPSNFGARIDIVAPTMIGTLYIAPSEVGFPAEWFASHGETRTQDGNYFSGTGTSAAAPIVTAVFGGVFSMNPALTRQQAIDVVLSTVSPFQDPTDTRYAKSLEQYFPGASRWGWPRGVVNFGKAVLKARSTLGKYAGRVFPYVGFISQAWVNRSTPQPYDVRYPLYSSYVGSLALFRETVGQRTVTFTRDAAGNITTTLAAGPVFVELAGYCMDAGGSDVPVTRVVLRVGSVTVYDGPPGTYSLDTTPWPSGSKLTVIAYTASGASGAETYGDVVIASGVAPSPTLTAGADAPVGGAVRLSGTRAADATVSVTEG